MTLLYDNYVQSIGILFAQASLLLTDSVYDVHCLFIPVTEEEDLRPKYKCEPGQVCPSSSAEPTSKILAI